MRIIFTFNSGYSMVCDYTGLSDFRALDHTRRRGVHFLESVEKLKDGMGYCHYPMFGSTGSYLFPEDEKQEANEEADLVGWEEEDGEIVYHLGTIDYVPEGSTIIKPFKDFTDRFYNNDLHFRLPEDEEFYKLLCRVAFSAQYKYIISLGDGTYVDFRRRKTDTKEA